MINPANTNKKIVTFYQQIYSDFEMWRPQGLIGNCPKVNNEDNVMLKGPFETQEIWDRMKACAGDKAPGPNGFSMAFSTSAGT